MDYWDGRFIMSVPNTPEDRQVALQILADRQITDFEERLLFVVARDHPPLANWYSNLPFDTRLRVIRDTAVRKSPDDTGALWRTYLTGDTSMQYKGVLSPNAWLLVYQDGGFELWAKAEDLERAE